MAIVRYIDLPAHLRRGIREKFGVTEGAVSLALNFRRNDGVSKETQEYALGLPGATLIYRAPANEMLHKSDKGEITHRLTSVVLDPRLPLLHCRTPLRQRTI